VDLCVIGGSCTGVFAAVRAARLGLSVAIVERRNCFGGTATAGLVNIWHSMQDVDYKETVIAGLSEEVKTRLLRDGAATVEENCVDALRFSPAALTGVLDDLVREHPGIYPYLNCMYAGVEKEGDAVRAVYIQNKDGRRAIRARFFLDASGDGDLLRDAGVPRYMRDGLQPPTYCFLMRGEAEDALLYELITRHGAEFGLDDDWGWHGPVPGLPGIRMRADNHVFGLDLSKAEDLTRAEMEGRRKAFALEKLLKKYAEGDHAIVSLAASVGIRETAHYETLFCPTAESLLTGERYPDAVLRGTYRIDIHHHEDNGITFYYLDGRKQEFYGKSGRSVASRWREGEDYARFYEVPFRALVPEGVRNLMGAGRLLHADRGAFGALRVMINLNQLGEAAGVAAYLAVHRDLSVQQIPGEDVRKLLKAGGSAL